MCGLVGCYGLVEHKEARAFAVLHHLDVLRGRDGAGVLTNNWNGVTKVYKGLYTPDDLAAIYPEVFTGKDNSIGKIQDINLLLGHNRASTVVNSLHNDNCHPFEFDRIIGAHNGTLPHYSKNKLDGGVNFTVDSEALFYNINKDPDNFPEFIKDVDGAMTLTFYNKHKKTLSLYRNEKRPLYVAVVNDKQTLFWASEKWMLSVALTRADITFSNEHIESYPVYLYTELKAKKKHGKVKLITLKSVTEVKYEPKYQNHYYAPPKPVGTPTSNIQHSNGSCFLKIGGKTYLTRFGAMEALRYGCSMCSAPLNIDDLPNTTKWFDKETPVCRTCFESNDPDFNYLSCMMENCEYVH